MQREVQQPRRRPDKLRYHAAGEITEPRKEREADDYPQIIHEHPFHGSVSARNGPFRHPLPQRSLLRPVRTHV